MNLDEVKAEYAKDGRVSGETLARLRDYLRTSPDPYDAITAAGDGAAFMLVPDLVGFLDHDDPMVRWNAASVLFNRFRVLELAQRCLKMVEEEEDEIARGAAITGLGEILPLVENLGLRSRMATALLSILENTNELTVMRGDAHAGMEIALNIPRNERVPASRLIDLERDVKPEVVAAFRKKFKV